MSTSLSAPDRLEIHSLHPMLRGYAVLVWGGFGIFMIGLAMRFPSTGHTIGYGIGAACLWAALYWWRLPEVHLAVRDDGVDWLDTTWGAFFRYRVRHTVWSDVTAVDTRPVVSRYGRYLRTRVTVRDAGDPARTRRFTVTSRHDGYTRFLDVLAEHTRGRAVELKGLGVQSARIHHEMRQLLGGQLTAIASLMLAAVVLVVVAALTRR